MGFRKRFLLLSGLLLLLLLFALLVAPAVGGAPRSLTVMTQNSYIGADMVPALLATSYDEFLEAVTFTYQQALNSNFPVRGDAIAAEIAAAQPHLVGLQEIALWRSGLSGPDPATEVEADMLAEIMDGLAERGASYTVLAAVEGFDGEFPTLLGVDARLTNYDVLLARSDVPDLKLSNVQSGTYEARLVIPSLYAGPVTVTRHWAAVDARLRGRRVRVITTHLEAASYLVRVTQAAELLDGPARTRLPVIVMGDLNAEPHDAGDSAWLLLANGFVDGWAEVNPGAPGLTCCQNADLANTSSVLSERIDLVLGRGTLVTTSAAVVGADPLDRPVPPFWLSDHAGVTAELSISR